MEAISRTFGLKKRLQSQTSVTVPNAIYLVMLTAVKESLALSLPVVLRIH